MFAKSECNYYITNLHNGQDIETNYDEQSSKKENVIKEISCLIMNSNLNNTEIEIILDWITAYVKYRERS